MTGLALATCDRALAPDGTAPGWVHLFPEGRMTGRDRRVFDLADPAALVLAFEAGGIDLPIDHEHQKALLRNTCLRHESAVPRKHQATRTISAVPRAEKRFICAMRMWISAVWRSGSRAAMRSPKALRSSR